MQLENWIAFCSIALLATASPGPAALLVSANSLSSGFKRSLATVFGNISGLFIMSGFSVLGLSAIVLNSAIAFTVIKALGAAYLVYMGVKLWKTGISKIELNESQGKERATLNLYVQGVFIALSNPKSIIFTTALFPQFIAVEEPLLPQFLVLVLSFMALSFLCLSGYAFVVHRTRSSTEKIVSGKWLGKVMGSIYIGVGCLLANTSRYGN